MGSSQKRGIQNYRARLASVVSHGLKCLGVMLTVVLSGPSRACWLRRDLRRRGCALS